MTPENQQPLNEHQSKKPVPAIDIAGENGKVARGVGYGNPEEAAAEDQDRAEPSHVNQSAADEDQQGEHSVSGENNRDDTKATDRRMASGQFEDQSAATQEVANSDVDSDREAEETQHRTEAHQPPAQDVPKEARH